MMSYEKRRVRTHTYNHREMTMGGHMEKMDHTASDGKGHVGTHRVGDSPKQ